MSHPLASYFLLNPAITYLNFGAFGACVKPVFEKYQQYQRQLEDEPCQFITVEGPTLLRKSRASLAEYLHCETDDVVFVTNPTYAVNIVAKSLRLKKGDEILSTHLEYGACDKTWAFCCMRTEANYVRRPVSLPLTTRQEMVDEFLSGVTGRTKAIFISHITSSTALILPVAEICAAAREKGILTIVDGAHAPGHIGVDLQALGADIYIGACHKWMMTPKGSSFMYVRKEWQHLLDPLVVSWGYESDPETSTGSDFIDYHQGQGTRDFSAFLTIPDAIEFMRIHEWEKVSANCKKMVKENAMRFCDLFGTAPLSPLTDEFIGQMFSIPIPAKKTDGLQRELFERYQIEVPVARHGDATYLRYSINAFNTQEDLDKLYEVLQGKLSRGEL